MGATFLTLPSYYKIQMIGLVLAIVLFGISLLGLWIATKNLMLRQLYQKTGYVSLLFLILLFLFAMTIEIIIKLK
jgi:hypothetical protein